jgi:hypothetical protein
LRGSEATKQSRLGYVKTGTDCVAYVLRTNLDEGSQKLSLDCFVASLPRNDGGAALPRDRALLHRHQLRDAAARQRQQLQQLRLAERRAFGGALHFDEAA